MESSIKSADKITHTMLPMYLEEARELADRINCTSVKFDKASGSRFLNEELAAAHIADFLSEFALRISDETRIRQTQEIMACLPINQ